MSEPKIINHTIAYHLRPLKAIERNLFLSLLKHLDRVQGIELKKYRYVGFGAAFLEDFKVLHAEFGIKKMHCIEYNSFAYSRQTFNKPFNFIELYNKSSTQYINEDFKEDLNQIIWWDFATPSELKQQLKDIEMTAEKITHFDILKFTFNANDLAFIQTHKPQGARKNNVIQYDILLKYLKDHETYKDYLPETVTSEDIEKDFSCIVRAMAVRAVKRGISKAGSNLDFHHLSSFTYADGQSMTTLTGIVAEPNNLQKILDQSSIDKWEFYKADSENELIPLTEIAVPVMTAAERLEIDKRIHKKTPQKLAKSLKFFYGYNEDEHLKLIEGYCTFYKYFPYFSKVTY